MILATGNRTNHTDEHSGFTLIEVVLVLGLIAFASTVMITNMASMAGRGEILTAEETLLAAVRRARLIAASERTTIQLRFDKKSSSLQISSQNKDVESFPLDKSLNERQSVEIRFYLIPASRGLAPFRDANSASLETKTVRFAADRSASPFVAEIDLGSGPPDRLQFDPFSSLLITSK